MSSSSLSLRSGLGRRGVVALLPPKPLSPSSSLSSRTTATTAVAVRTLSGTAARRAGGSDSHYDPPTGYLWGVPPNQKAEKEGWENLWYYGFFGSLGLGAVAYAFKPDTSIETWALEEAKRRLQAEGTLPEDDAAEKS